MSGNKLLTESTIRRFMKLANVDTLTDNFLSENQIEEGPAAKAAKSAAKTAANAAKKAVKTVADDENVQRMKRSNPAARIAAAAGKAKSSAAPYTNEGFEDEDTLEEQAELEDEELEVDAELGEPEDDVDAMADMDAEMGEEPEMGAADMSLTEEEARLLIDLGERLSAVMEETEGEEGEDIADIEEPADEEPAAEDVPEEEEEDAPYRDPVMEQEELVQEVLKRVTKRLVAAKLRNRK